MGQVEGKVCEKRNKRGRWIKGKMIRKKRGKCRKVKKKEKRR